MAQHVLPILLMAIGAISSMAGWKGALGTFCNSLGAPLTAIPLLFLQSRKAMRRPIRRLPKCTLPVSGSHSIRDAVKACHPRPNHRRQGNIPRSRRHCCSFCSSLLLFIISAKQQKERASRLFHNYREFYGTLISAGTLFSTASLRVPLP